MSDIIIENIIIGGGLSGIAAGRRLQENNIQFLILEARDVLGGRVCTYQTQDIYNVDIGASWVGKNQPIMYSLCKQLKVELTQQYEKGQNILLLNNKKIFYTGLIPKIDIWELINYGWGQFKLDRLANTVNLKEPMKTKDALYLDSITFDQYLKQVFREIPYSLIIRAFELVFGVKVSQMSLLYALQYIKAGKGCDSLFKGIGGAQEFKFVGGTSNFVNKFAEVIKDKIRLSHAVVEIDDNPSNSYVIVRTENNLTFRCKKVIVTAPARVLQNIQFTTPLPPKIQFLIINQKSYGHVYKFNLIYDKPFWRNKNLSGFVLNPNGLLNMTFDGETDPKASYSKLIGFLDQDFVEGIGRNYKKEITKQLMKELEVFFGPEVHSYRELIYGDLLSSDKYIGGCPTGVLAPVNLTMIDGSLQIPTGNLYWAGTETSDIWQGFMEGAIRSGYRSANQVLGLQEINEPESSQSWFKLFFIFAFLVIILAYLFS